MLASALTVTSVAPGVAFAGDEIPADVVAQPGDDGDLEGDDDGGEGAEIVFDDAEEVVEQVPQDPEPAPAPPPAAPTAQAPAPPAPDPAPAQEPGPAAVPEPALTQTAEPLPVQVAPQPPAPPLAPAAVVDEAAPKAKKHGDGGPSRSTATRGERAPVTPVVAQAPVAAAPAFETSQPQAGVRARGTGAGRRGLGQDLPHRGRRLALDDRPPQSSDRTPARPSWLATWTASGS